MREFAQREGHASVPRAHVEDGVTLGIWVEGQRLTYRNNKLSEKRQFRLEQIPGWLWNPNDAKWERAYKLLKKYVEREGHAAVQHHHQEEDFALGHWVSSQRQNYIQGCLPEERISRLERLPGWTWFRKADRWEQSFNYLVQYVGRHRHARVPYRHREEGFALGVWVTSQRKQYKDGKLYKERIRRLESLPGWTWCDRPQNHTHHQSKISTPSTTEDPFDEMAEEIWKSLFGQGALPIEEAVEQASQGLLEAGLITDRFASEDNEQYKKVRQALNIAIDFAFLDVPKEGYCRAVLPHPADWESDDWFMCLEVVLSERAMNRVDAICKSAIWAKENLGLDIPKLSEDSLVWRKLEDTINDAIKTRKIKQIIFFGEERLQLQ